MTWTESQRKAIKEKNKTLLVSAGAGSGKTTVLTRRITERILAGDSIEDFLVVTFTRPAAADLKEKLYISLIDAIAEQPNNKHLFNQLFLLAGAKISTIDSFCHEVVKSNFATLGLSPKIRIADESETPVIAVSCFEELVDQLYEEQNESFLLLVDNFSGVKSDDILIEKLLDLYNRLRSFHRYIDWLNARTEELREQAERINQGFFKTKTGALIQERILDRLGEAKRSCERLLGFLSSKELNGKNKDIITELHRQILLLEKAANTDYNELYSLFLSVGRTANLNTNEMEDEDAKFLKTEKSLIVKALKDIKMDFCSIPQEKIYEDYIFTVRVSEAISEVITSFDKKFSEVKIKKNLLDYSDLEHYTVNLLEEKDKNGCWVRSELCIKLRNRIKEIYIDEYQDVNPLQDRIFTLLSQENNRFMVGDVKQSIYRFRNAYPEIFINYKESFPDIDKSESNCARIFLKENFRCSSSIIDFVNNLFTEITKNNRFSREYENEELIFKKSSDTKQSVVLALSAYKDIKGGQEAREREAEYVAYEIENLVCNQKKEDGSVIKYGDIALLFSAVKGRAQIYQEALSRRGIPYRIDKKENIFDFPEIMLAISALKTIDNPTDDISLCALLRSPLYNFTADDLYRIRSNCFGLSFFDSVIAASALSSLKRKRIKGLKYAIKLKKTGRPVTIIKKCRVFLSELDFYRIKAQGMQCYKLLWLFYSKSGFLSLTGSMENGDKCKQNLLLLYQYARDYESSGYKGISAFISYIDTINERGGSLAEAILQEPDGDYVHIMSIHKSKGLEWPVCFVVDCARRFGSRESNNDLILSRKLGISCKIKNNEKLIVRDTYLRKYALIAEKDSGMSEELRKLYVALTRAKERLYVTAHISEDLLEQYCIRTDISAKYQSTENSAQPGIPNIPEPHLQGSINAPMHTSDFYKNDFNPLKAKSFSDWLLQAVSNKTKPYIVVDIIPENHSFPYNSFNKSFDKEQEEISTDILAKIRRAIDYKYPHKDAVGIPAKLSVSELSDDRKIKAVIAEKAILRRPEFLAGIQKSGAVKGTANHIFMQFVDFAFVEKEGVEAEAKRLLNKRMITQEQFDLLSYESLRAFFASDIYKGMKSAKRLFREKRFSILCSADILGGPKREKILIQGVIDCFFESNDRMYTLVDYKTDYIPKDGGEKILVKRYSKQLELYCRAITAMTGKPVSRVILYSFYLGIAIEVNLKE